MNDLNNKWNNRWDGNKNKIQFMIRINLSGLHEIRKMKYFKDCAAWYDRSGDISWRKGQEDTVGCWNKIFDNIRDAETFISGAKFFREFMCQGFFTQH